MKREVYPLGSDTSDPANRISEVIYTYGDSNWGDLLTAYNGAAITYDGIGNPLNDGTWTYTWQHGRQLASMSKLDSSAQWSFAYNADGLRTQRTNGTTTYSYTYLGSQLTHLTVDGQTMYFAYDAAGVPMALTYNGVNYNYVTNLQGDVVAILNNSGVEVVRYTYDAWGNPISTTGTRANSVGFYNPLRYRGYVYDAETQLYYLQSRYYNPEIGRFINADGFTSTGQGLLGNNMFTYCNNNPVICRDSAGMWTMGVSVGASVYLGFGVSVSIGYFWDDNGNGEFQWSYCVPGVNDTAAMGVCAIGAGVTYQWTNYDTVSDLYGLGSTLGGSAGPGWYCSIESVLEGSISERENVSRGIQIGIGYGAGAEIHVANTQTNKVGKKKDSTSVRGSTFAYHFPDPYFQQYTSNAPAHVPSVFCRCLLCKNNLI